MSPAAQLGIIVENIGVGEIVVIAFLVLVVLGPDRIPEMARGAGRMINNAKKFTSSLTGDMADVINDPAMQPIKELGEFATRPRQKLAEYALEAEAEERQRKADEAVSATTEGADPGDATAADGSSPAQGTPEAAAGSEAPEGLHTPDPAEAEEHAGAGGSPNAAEAADLATAQLDEAEPTEP